jgi:hypothetical protein
MVLLSGNEMISAAAHTLANGEDGDAGLSCMNAMAAGSRMKYALNF